MSLLVDAHVLIWLYAAPSRLPDAIVDAIRDEARAKWVSAATIWEIEIKRISGRLQAPRRSRRAGLGVGLLELPITAGHAVAAAALPAHHSDPFDRMLVAQALAEDLTIASADAQIARYGVPLLTL